MLLLISLLCFLHFLLFSAPYLYPSMPLTFLESPFLKAIRTVSLLTAFFLLIGGHWAVLQSVAWGKMVASYSREGSLEKAVEKTFSGQHPCSLCKKISTERQKETKAPWSLEKKEAFSTFLMEASLSLLSPLIPKEFCYPLLLNHRYSPPIFPPLTPPPMSK